MYIIFKTHIAVCVRILNGSESDEIAAGTIYTSAQSFCFSIRKTDSFLTEIRIYYTLRAAV